jgi:type III pantothenate kinase
MLLVLDVGNSNTVIGLMLGTTVQQTFRVRTKPRTTDEFGLLLVQLLRQFGYDKSVLTGAICGSVVPSEVYAMRKACQRYLDLDLLLVGRGLKTGIKVRTDNPREVGADRIVNAVAAVERWGGPVVIVDFGTATTFDCVNGKGEYVGGAIAPGLRISEQALFEQTAKLPRVEVAQPPRAIGTNTKQAMQSGLFFGYAGLVDSLARRCRDELGANTRVVATGGLARLVCEECVYVDEVEPHLTLRGLALLHALNTN